MLRSPLLLSVRDMPDALPQSHQNTIEPPRRRRWLGLPVNREVRGSLAEVLNLLPHFGRQPFTMNSVNGTEIAMNPYLDMIYQAPVRQGENPVPVGVVSKNYRLVDHHHILRTLRMSWPSLPLTVLGYSCGLNGHSTANGRDSL
jgi:hypothetical protein